MAGIAELTGSRFATFLNALKPMWLDGAEAFFQSRASVLARLERSTQGVYGRHIEGSRNVGRTEGFGGSHHGNLGLRIADPDHAKYGRPKGSLANFSARGKLEQRVMQMARTAPGAFIENVRGEMSTLLRDYRYDMSQQIFSDGSGRIAVITEATDLQNGQLTCKHIFDLPSTTGAGQGDKLFRVREGMMVGILDTSECTSGAGNQSFIANGSGLRHFMVISVVGNLVTLGHPQETIQGSSAIDMRTAGPNTFPQEPAIGDYLVRTIIRHPVAANGAPSSDVYSDDASFHTFTGYRKVGEDGDYTTEKNNIHFGAAELIGYPAYAGTGGVFLEMGAGSTPVLGDVCGLSASQYQDWNGFVDANGGVARDVTDRMFHLSIMNVEQEGEGRVSNITCHPYIQERIKSILLQENVRYIPTQASGNPAEASVRAMEYQGRAILPELTCPASTAFLCDESELQLKQLMELDYIDEDGSIFDRMPDHAAFQFSLTYYAQTWIKTRRNRFSRIDDLLVAPAP